MLESSKYIVDPDKPLNIPVIPSISYAKAEQTYQDLLAKENKILKAGGTYELTPEQQHAVTTLIYSGRASNKDDMPGKTLNEHPENFVNDINYADSNLNPAVVNFKETGNKLSGANAVAIFRSFLSVGNVINVPLWHSGFWVVIKPPTQTEIVNLQLALAGNEIELGRDTNSLIYSNYSVVFTRIIADFVVDHINSTSLKLSEDDDIRDYISLHDFYPLVAGMLASMNPAGIEIARGCINNAELDDDGKPKCTFTVKGKIDPKKLTWVNRSKITAGMLNHMSKKGINISKKEDVREYQLQLETTQPKEYEIETSVGAKFKVILKIPTLKDNIVRGEEWVNEIINLAQKLFSDGDGAEEKNRKIDSIAFSSVLGIYNTFIDSFVYEDGRINDDKTTFNTILSDISLDETAFTNFLQAIKDYISYSPIAVVATPNYVCPECRTKQKQEDPRDAFKEFIPLNVVEHFFAHCATRIEKTRSPKL